MNTKKSPPQDLENKKVLFFKIGLVLSLLLVLLAFEYKKTQRVVYDPYRGYDVTVDIDIIDITLPKPPEPPPAPEPFEITTLPDDEITDEPDVHVTVEVPENYRAPDLRLDDYDKKEPLIDNEVFVRAEFDPEFPGGTEALFAYFARNLRYPRLAQELNIQGTVFIGFVVERDGSVSNVHVIRGIGGGCDEEALRAVKNMPRWSPGRMGTQPVRVSFSVPVVFRLK